MQDITKVLTPDLIDTPHPESPHHRANGQFAKGNTASPGRRKRSEEAAVLAAIDAACPPEKLKELLEKAITWTEKHESPKGALAIAQFVVGYRIGTPVQRSISASGKLENLLNRISDMDEEEFNTLEAEMRRD